MELLWSLFETLVGILLIVGIIWLVVAFVLGRVSRRSISRMLKTHFAPVPPERLAVHERLFPVQIRADLQQAVEQFLAPTTLRTFR
jgi:cell division protease FtsH